MITDKELELERVKQVVELIEETNRLDIDIGALEKNGEVYELMVCSNEARGVAGKVERSRSLRKIDTKVGCGIPVKEYIKVPRVNVKDLEAVGINESRYKSAMAEVNKINKNKSVAVPFLFGTKIAAKEYDWAEGKVTGVRWELNMETKEIEGYLIARVFNRIPRSTAQIPSFRVPLTKYGELIRVYGVKADASLKAHKYMKEVVKVDNTGFIKPVRFVMGDTEVIVDNKKVWGIKNGRQVGVVAELSNGWFSDIDYDFYDLVEEIQDTAWWIEMHRKYMLPYGTTKTSTVKVREAEKVC